MVAKTDLVQYIGGATRRSISIQEFKDGAGITATKDLVWDWKNKMCVPVGDMNEETLDYLMDEHNREFQVIKPKDAPTEEMNESAVTGQGAPPVTRD
jgi:hypothetical protein